MQCSNQGRFVYWSIFWEKVEFRLSKDKFFSALKMESARSMWWSAESKCLTQEYILRHIGVGPIWTHVCDGEDIYHCSRPKKWDLFLSLFFLFKKKNPLLVSLTKSRRQIHYVQYIYELLSKITVIWLTN